MAHSPPIRFYPIGTPGQPWGAAERSTWKAQIQIQRSYKTEVLDKLEPLKEHFVVEQYGALSYDADRYPLYYVKSRDWVEGKPSVLVTGTPKYSAKNQKCEFVEWV